MEHLIMVTHQVNAGKDYFYPHNELAHAIVGLMQRKALVPDDLPKLKALGTALGLTLRIQTVGQEVSL